MNDFTRIKTTDNLDNRIALTDVTCIRLQTEELGAEATRMLLERVGAPTDTGAARSKELPTELIVRGSTVKA